MTVRSVYECDLCGEETESTKVVGFHRQYNGIEVVFAPDAETHVCRDCVIVLANQFGILKGMALDEPSPSEAE